MILCLTYIFIKLRAPKLPAHHKGRDFMKSVLMMVVSWIVAFIAYGSFMVKGRHTKIEEWLISQTIANTFSNFFVPRGVYNRLFCSPSLLQKSARFSLFYTRTPYSYYERESSPFSCVCYCSACDTSAELTLT